VLVILREVTAICPNSVLDFKPHDHIAAALQEFSLCIESSRSCAYWCTRCLMLQNTLQTCWHHSWWPFSIIFAVIWSLRERKRWKAGDTAFSIPMCIVICCETLIFDCWFKKTSEGYTRTPGDSDSTPLVECALFLL